MLGLLRRFPIFLACAFLGTVSLRGQAFNDFDLAPHNYYQNERKDPMTRLLDRAEAGEITLERERGLPLLRQILSELAIPESSQILVFSKTSLQRDLIEPSNPRALYFNEETHVAWMPGGKIEVISFDADSGGRFYIEDPAKDPAKRVSFTSPRSCFGCHGGAATNFLPGPLARSHLTSAEGQRLRAVAGHDRISHAVPFSDRWGGYFVTGVPASLAHLGNHFAERIGSQIQIDRERPRAWSDLGEIIEEGKFPRRTSDVVPLLVFDHQIEAHNLIVEARHRDRQFWYEHEKFEGEVTGKTRRDTETFFDRFVRYLLFADEELITGHKIARSPEFEEAFRSDRRVDAAGRSLKDFDLEDRLFANRLSYMIQSRPFLDAPPSMKNRVYERLWQVLSGPEPPVDYDYFEPGERARLLTILRETQPDLPDSWKVEQPLASSRSAE